VVVVSYFVMCLYVGVGFVMCGCFDNCVGVWVIWILVFAAFCVGVLGFYCFLYVYYIFFIFVCLY
jgi:hypothetical protein